MNHVHVTSGLRQMMERNSHESAPIRLLISAIRKIERKESDARQCEQSAELMLAAADTAPEASREGELMAALERERAARIRRYQSRILNPRSFGNYHAFREKKGLISYMPSGKEQEITGDGDWSLKGRQAMAPGKWLRAMLNPKVIVRLGIKDHEFSILSSAVKHEELAEDLKFRFADFSEAYNHCNYRIPVFESCMWDMDVGPFYESFGARCLVCVDGNGELRARAVVWMKVIVYHGMDDERMIVLMDRIYADSPEVVVGMKAHAAEKGWYSKLRQARDSKSTIVSPSGEPFDVRMRVTALRHLDCDTYPYLDTFASGEGRSLYNDESSEREFLYLCTDGCREEIDQHAGEVQDVYGDWISEEDAVRVNGDYYHYDDDAIVRCCDDEYRLLEDCEEVDGQWYPNDSPRIVYSEPEERCILRKSAVEIDGEYYSPDNEDIVLNEDGTWVLRKDLDLLEEDEPEPWSVRSSGDEYQLLPSVLLGGELVKGS